MYVCVSVCRCARPAAPQGRGGVCACVGLVWDPSWRTAAEPSTSRSPGCHWSPGSPSSDKGRGEHSLLLLERLESRVLT